MRSVVVAFACAITGYVLETKPAWSHSWYPPECCSGQDCHPVPCETLRENVDGSLTYTPTGNDFEQRKIRASQDAQCHICTSSPDGRGYPYCAFTVQGF